MLPNRNKSSAIKKIALVVGNDDYSASSNKLTQSIENAKTLAKILENIGFNVTMKPNLRRKDLIDAIKNFENNIKESSLAVFYYSGHACQANDINYIIPIKDDELETDKDLEERAVNLQRNLAKIVKDPIQQQICENDESMREKTKKQEDPAVIIILDCPRKYSFKTSRTAKAEASVKGLHKMTPTPGTLLQFSCDVNSTVDDHMETVKTNLFTERLLQNIDRKNVDVRKILKDIVDGVYEASNHQQRPLTMDALSKDQEVFLNKMKSFVPNIPEGATWKSSGDTIRGGIGPGSDFKRLNTPRGLDILNENQIVTADTFNHRVLKNDEGRGQCKKIAGKDQSGYGSNSLWQPSNVIFHEHSKSFIISDTHNRRILQISNGKQHQIKTLMNHIECDGLAFDNEGFIYASDTEHHQVIRFQIGDTSRVVVAGGNGSGQRLKQLHHPTYIAVGEDQAVYVSDSWNNRVVKWPKDAKEGIIVAGANGKGRGLAQLDCPAGLIIDQNDTIYVADYWNHRIMRWSKDSMSGERIIGGQYRAGDDETLLNHPEGLDFDTNGNLYVSDSKNHRIQCFHIQTT